MKSVFDKSCVFFTVPLVLVCFGISFLTVFVRIESIKLGYEIGHLKNKERTLLEKTYQLEKNLSILTTKSSLLHLASKAKD